MKIVELIEGSSPNFTGTKRFRLFAGGSTSTVTDPKLVLYKGVGIEELNTDADFKVSTDPAGNTVVELPGKYAGGEQTGRGLFTKWADGDLIAEFTLVGNLSRTYDGHVTAASATRLPTEQVRIGTLLFGDHTFKLAA